MIRTSDWLHLVVVIFITMYLLGCSSDQEQIQPSSLTPDFVLKTIKGDEIKLKDYRGEKVVHLIFWSTWCAECLMEMPKLKKLWDTKSDEPYEILAINVCLNESQDRIKRIQEKYQHFLKVVFDEKREVTKKFGVVSIPYHIIIDKEGNIKDRFNELP